MALGCAVYSRHEYVVVPPFNINRILSLCPSRRFPLIAILYVLCFCVFL